MKINLAGRQSKNYGKEDTMEKVIFFSEYERIDPRIILEVERFLSSGDRKLLRSSLCFVPVLNLKKVNLERNEELIPRSWWRKLVNDFYVWEELANYTQGYEPKGRVFYRAAAAVLCFLAYAELEEPALEKHVRRAADFVRAIRCHFIWRAGAEKLANGVRVHRGPWIANAERQCELDLGEDSYWSPWKYQSRDPEIQLTPVVCRLELSTTRKIESASQYERSLIERIDLADSPLGISFFISLLIRYRPAEGVPIKVLIFQNNLLLRETSELHVTSDEYGFFNFRDLVSELVISKPGFLEFVPVYHGVQLVARRLDVLGTRPLRSSKAQVDRF